MSGLAQAIRRATSALSEPPPKLLANVRATLGAVAVVTPGAAADGNAAVTVTVGADQVPAPYLASYTPAVGDTVLMLFLDGSPVIAGKVIGAPTY